MSPRLKEIIHHLKIVKYLATAKHYNSKNKQLFNCPVCGARDVEMYPVPGYFLGKWQKYKTIHNPFFLETMNLEYYLCSKCFSPDRDRLYALYFEEYFKENNTQIHLLDIAPSDPLRNLLKANQQVVYRSMDLMMENVDDTLDITNMHIYKNGQFDFFICSHVLEHIPDDEKAMRELYRIIKTGGKGIVMVPVNLQLTATIEDAECKDEEYRWTNFFQDDHVRMYSKNDFIQRLANTGFKVNCLDEVYFGNETFYKNAIFPTSVLYVVEK